MRRCAAYFVPHGAHRSRKSLPRSIASTRKIRVMLTAAKEGTFSASSDPCVFFPLAAAAGVSENSRLGFKARKRALF